MWNLSSLTGDQIWSPALEVPLKTYLICRLSHHHHFSLSLQLMWWRHWSVSILEFPTVWSLWILTFMVSSYMYLCLLSLQDLDLEAWSALGKIIRQEYIKGKAVYFHQEARDCTISLLWVSLPLIIMTQRHSLMRLCYGGIQVQRFSSGGGFVPKGRLSMTRDIFGPHGWRDDAGTWWGEASMLLNILWCPGRHPSSYPAQVSILPRLRSPILI